MNKVSEQILIEALDLLEQGVGIEEIVSRYQSDANDLRSFLLTAAALSTLATQPSLAAQQESRGTFLAAAEAMAQETAPRAGRWIQRALAPIFVALAVIFLSGLALVGASGSAVPGDALYETKRTVEDLRLAWTTNPERAAELREQFRRRRLDEIAILLAAGREEKVSFTGTVEVLNLNGRWVVGGIPVIVDSFTVLDGDPDVGSLVQVDGRTVDGAVAAELVLVLSSRIDPTPLPKTPTPSFTVTPSVTTTMTPPPTRIIPTITPTVEGQGQLPVVTVEPSPTPVPPSTAQPEQPPTPIPPSTAQPEQPPTPIPISPSATPDDDANDNSDDGGSSNANDNDSGEDNDDSGDNDGGNENDNGNDNDDDNSGDSDDND